MTASDVISYRTEILGFLSSCTLKSSWMADVLNSELESAGVEVDTDQPSTWKYYLNLFGEYHETDTIMTVQSRDTQEEISFTKENLAFHTRTAAAYRPGEPGYNTLCKRYPTQVDLIKNILFPVKSIDAAIAADELDLIGWGSGYLEDSETESIINYIKKTLEFMGVRWYQRWLDYDVYYYPYFWATIWHHLYQAVVTKRLLNINTAQAHSFHVWNYLSSYGIADYRDILTRRQTMFLYRNIRYIMQNRGREENLILLVNELLTEQSIAMSRKVIKQQTLDRSDTCEWTPEITSEIVNTNKSGSLRELQPQSISDHILTLLSQGYETRGDADYVLRQTDVVAATRTNELVTKFLEIRPILKDNRYRDILNNFILDNLVNIAHNDLFSQNVVVEDPHLGVLIRLSMKEAAALLHYASCRSLGETPESPPEFYQPLTGTFKSDLGINPPASYVMRGDERHNFGSYVDVDEFLDGAIPPISQYNTFEEVTISVMGMFGAFIRQLLTIRHQGTLRGAWTLQRLQALSMDREVIELDLIPFDTYAEWFEAPGNELTIGQIYTAYDEVSDTNALYGELANEILRTIIPDDHPAVIPYLESLEVNPEFYSRVKELFVQLCSYTVSFLDTDRSFSRWSHLSRIFGDRKDSLSDSTLITKLPTTSNIIDNISAFEGRLDVTKPLPGKTKQVVASGLMDRPVTVAVSPVIVESIASSLIDVGLNHKDVNSESEGITTVHLARMTLTETAEESE